MTWTVSDVMTKDVVTVGPATPFKTCADLLRIQEMGAVPVVVADGRLVGILSEADLLLKEAQVEVRDRHGSVGPTGGKADAMTAGELMTADVVTTTASTPLATAASLMFQHRAKVLPVVDSENRLVGIVSRSHVLEVFLRSDESIRREVARDYLHDMPLIGRGHVEAEVMDGVVHLYGEVETGSLTGLLVRLVAGVPGVVGVTSHLKLTSKLGTADLAPAADSHA